MFIEVKRGKTGGRNESHDTQDEYAELKKKIMTHEENGNLNLI